MTYNSAQIRSAMTAIAAVLALSSAPLFAHDAGPAETSVQTPPVAAPDPLAPEPGAEPAPSATETATEPAAPPAPRPKVEAAKTSSPAAAKAATRRTAATARPPSSTRSSAAVSSAPAPIAAPAAEELIDAPVAAAPVAAPPAAPVDPAAVDQAQELDNMLELAGGAGLGVLALAGVGLALRSRRRRKEEERIEEAKWAIIEATPDVETQAQPEPAFTRPPAPTHDPVPPATTPAQASAPATKLPDGFDLSQFGRHVQAAYRGPTPDNPSVSLEYRLRRASFLDQKEQDAREAAAPAAKVPEKGNWESRSDADFLFRRAGSKNSAKPEYQR